MIDEYISTDYEKVMCLKNTLMTRATGGSYQVGLYEELRKELLGKPDIAKHLPAWLRTHRRMDEFWQFIKTQLSSYAGRRQFLTEAFNPALTYLETTDNSPSKQSIDDSLKTLDINHIHDTWTKALDRRNNDPEGAITSARALLESTCKSILDELEIAHSDNDLPKLYAKVAEALNIAPSQHTERVFKQILGGCHSVVEGLGALRNRIGDAHGQGKHPVKPAPRHAELAVNFAGAMAAFLVATYKERKRK